MENEMIENTKDRYQPNNQETTFLLLETKGKIEPTLIKENCSFHKPITAHWNTKSPISYHEKHR